MSHKTNRKHHKIIYYLLINLLVILLVGFGFYQFDERDTELHEAIHKTIFLKDGCQNVEVNLEKGYTTCIDPNYNQTYISQQTQLINEIVNYNFDVLIYVLFYLTIVITFAITGVYYVKN